MHTVLPGERSMTGTTGREHGEIHEVDEILDQALRLVADHHRLLGLQLGRPAFSPSIAELRQSPLGRDLRLLAHAVGSGVLPADIRAAASRVTETLLRPLAADGFETPDWFWASELGRIVSRAERFAAGEGAWLAPAVAAMSLGTTEDDILDWAVSGVLPWLPDDLGRPLVSRAAVDRMRMVAMKIVRDRHEAPPVTGPDRLSA